MDVFEDTFHLYTFICINLNVLNVLWNVTKIHIYCYSSNGSVVFLGWEFGVHGHLGKTFVVRTQPEILRAKNLNDIVYEGLEFFFQRLAIFHHHQRPHGDLKSDDSILSSVHSMFTHKQSKIISSLYKNIDQIWLGRIRIELGLKRFWNAEYKQ